MQVVRTHDLGLTPGGTLVFEGSAFGSGVSFFAVNNAPGEGPGLHTHPYPETWLVRSGRVRFTVGDDAVDAGPGDVVVVEAGTPHAFRNSGAERLEVLCMHPSPTFIQRWLDDETL